MSYKDQLFLQHFGVPGMRWGHRKSSGADSGPSRKQIRNSRINRNIEFARKTNSLRRETTDQNIKEYAGKPKQAKKQQRLLAKSKAMHDMRDTELAYIQLRQRAKSDKKIKNSPEYKAARKAFGKQTANTLVLGPVGALRVETLKNLGKSERAAKGRVIAEQLVLGVAMGSAAIGSLSVASLIDNY